MSNQKAEILCLAHGLIKEALHSDPFGRARAQTKHFRNIKNFLYVPENSDAIALEAV